MTPKLQDAVVRWFDNRSGEGFIRIGERSIFVHWGAIASGFPESSKPKNSHKQPKQLWCVLFPGQKVRVKVIEDYNWTQISLVKEA